jgi:dihydrofolate reductase
MRKVTYGAACSLDGYIAGPDGALDWLYFSKDVQQIMSEYWKTIDTILMGRKTWEQAVKQGTGGAPSSTIRTFVFSRTLQQAPRGVELVREHAGAFVRSLKQQNGKDICLMGGGELARALFDEGVIDEVGLNIHPILLGSGVPMFGQSEQRVELELLESRALEGGCMLVTYGSKQQATTSADKRAP